MVAAQESTECFYGVSDLHAMTTTHDPVVLRAAIAEVTTLFLALGLDPDKAVLFRQSRVPAHRELAYLLECTAYTGELARMIQYKEKGRDQPSTRVSLYTYPVLMAADILLYRPTQVPVGDDQRQHVELTRDLAVRFNNTYGAVFTVPEIVTPAAGARVMDLQDPARKMSKSAAPGADGGVIRLLDPPDVVRRKVARAVTDFEDRPGVPYGQRKEKPGVSNLLDALAACGGSADGITTYGALKGAVTEAGGWRCSNRRRRGTPTWPPTPRTSPASSRRAAHAVTRSPRPSWPLPRPRWGWDDPAMDARERLSQLATGHRAAAAIAAAVATGAIDALAEGARAFLRTSRPPPAPTPTRPGGCCTCWRPSACSTSGVTRSW